MNYTSPDDNEKMIPTDDEAKIGFELKVIQYPAKLPFSTSSTNEENIINDRAIVLEIDEEHRIRRRKLESGYVLEKWDGTEWIAQTTYPSLKEVIEDVLVKQYLARRKNCIDLTEEENDE